MQIQDNLVKIEQTNSRL